MSTNECVRVYVRVFGWALATLSSVAHGCLDPTPALLSAQLRQRFPAHASGESTSVQNYWYKLKWQPLTYGMTAVQGAVKTLAVRSPLCLPKGWAP